MDLVFALLLLIAGGSMAALARLAAREETLRHFGDSRW